MDHIKLIRDVQRTIPYGLDGLKIVGLKKVKDSCEGYLNDCTPANSVPVACDSAWNCLANGIERCLGNLAGQRVLAGCHSHGEF